MPNTTRLSLKTVELTGEGILIRSVEIIDSVSGETLRPAKLTEELAKFISVLEINLDDYFTIQAMAKKNPELKKLIDTFKLYT